MTKLHQFLYNYRNSIIAWLLIVLLAVLGIHYGVDSTLLSLVILLVGILGQAFGALLAWIGLIPVVGPLIAKVLALPFFWILNGVGYSARVHARGRQLSHPHRGSVDRHHNRLRPRQADLAFRPQLVLHLSVVLSML